MSSPSAWRPPAYLIDGAEDLQKSWFDGVERIGITAGASAPEVLVRGVIQQLQAWGATGADELAGREGEHHILHA